MPTTRARISGARGNAGGVSPRRATAPATRETEGQRLLRARTETLSELGAKLGVNKSSVHRWLTGEKTPGPEARAQMEAALGIPGAAWGMAAGVDVEVAAVKPTQRAAALGRVAGRVTTEDSLDLILEKIRSIETESLLPTERARIAEIEAKVVAQRYRCEREREAAVRQAEDRLTEHPSFRALVRALTTALRPWPEAMRAAVEVLSGAAPADERAA